MKKTPKNIPTYYNFPGTPIFRDTTALPFGLGGPTNNPVLPTVPARTIDTNINPTIEPFVVPSFSNFDKYAGKHYHYDAGTNEYLIKRSSELYKLNDSTADIQPLLDEITNLRSQIIDNETEIIALQEQVANQNVKN